MGVSQRGIIARCSTLYIPKCLNIDIIYIYINKNKNLQRQIFNMFPVLDTDFLQGKLEIFY